MSTSQPIPIQVSLPSKGPAITSPSQGDSLETDSKGVFDGVLNDELATTSEVSEIGNDVEIDAGINTDLPLDGNSLPPAINSQLQADIAELDLDLDVIDASVLTALETLEPVIVNPSIVPSVSKGIAAVSELTLKQADAGKQSDVIRFVNTTANVAKKPDAVNPLTSLVASNDLELNTEIQAVTKFKETLQLEKSLSPLVRQADVGQIGRVLEQFSELNQKATLAPTISTAVSSTPLVDGGTTTTVTTPQLTVDVPVQDKRWQKAFSQRVVWAVGNAQSAQLRLNPAELGRIDIQVNIENDKANVVFNAQNGAVKEAIEQALPRLKEMLAEQGVELEKAEIFNENFNQQQQASTQNGSSDSHDGDANGWSGIREDEVLEESHIGQISLNDDIVDYYV